jgi:hypothetical protein
MAPRSTKHRLQHDRAILLKTLEDYEAGAMTHLDEIEQATIVEGIARRIADIDAEIEALDGA